MDRKRILLLSDLDMIGSGYFNIATPLASGLSEIYDIKALGLGYAGNEHNYPFSIIPVKDFQEVFAMLGNLHNLWTFDVMITALDIPIQRNVLKNISSRPFKYIGIMPIEADPLCLSWSMVLMQMDKSFIISNFGMEEAKKAGIDSVEHLKVGIDTDSWRVPTEEEKRKIRQSMFGVEDDTFIVLTVADNQERKNLARAMEIFAKFNKKVPHSKYVMVTKEHAPVGWQLRDYAQELGINNNYLIFERGLPFKELWSIYAGSDAFLLTSKAEGLCMPVLESMAVGIPVAATDCTAVGELVSAGRGWGIKYDYTYRDPFGNGRRYLASIKSGVECLLEIYDLDNLVKERVATAHRFVNELKWEVAVDQVSKSIEEVINAD